MLPSIRKIRILDVDLVVIRLVQQIYRIYEKSLYLIVPCFMLVVKLKKIPL